MHGSAYVRDPAHTPSPTSIRPRRERHAAEYLDGLSGLLERLEQIAAGVVTCEACGCLCRPDEVCPGCQAARQ